MNENLNLVEILKDCPCGTKMYSTIHGHITFIGLDLENPTFPILVLLDMNGTEVEDSYTKEGKYFTRFKDDECCLFPSKEQRDWSKFTAPWYKKERFDPKTFKLFDKVLIRRGSESYNTWFPDFISETPNDIDDGILCMCVKDDVAMVIPYNEDTKHLVGTSEEAPEYYRYWED